jgi:hypothetical protein
MGSLMLDISKVAPNMWFKVTQLQGGKTWKNAKCNDWCVHY